MQIFTMGLGLILLVLGRKLFWLCVAVLGFFLGMAVAGALLVDQPMWVMLLMGLGAGLLGGLLAILAQRVAFATAGFYAGAYLALSAAAAFGFGGHRTVWFAAGGGHRGRARHPDHGLGDHRPHQPGGRQRDRRRGQHGTNDDGAELRGADRRRDGGASKTDAPETREGPTVGKVVALLEDI
jgi:hypothetical protein